MMTDGFGALLRGGCVMLSVQRVPALSPYMNSVNYLLFQLHLHRLPRSGGEGAAASMTKKVSDFGNRERWEGVWAGSREALKKTCLCLNYLAFSLCWFHRSLDFFQKCCFAKGVWSKVGLLVNRILLSNNRIWESSAPGRSLSPKWWGEVGNGLHLTSCYFLSTQVALGIGPSTS